MAALALAGCSDAGHSAGTAGTAGTLGPVTVNSVPAPGATTQVSLSQATTAPAADNTSAQQLSAVDSDLSGIDTATSQADSDTSAGDSAEAQSDNP